MNEKLTREHAISSKLELCIERMNTIHGRVDIIRGKISWDWYCDVESTALSSIEWMATTLLDMVIYLHEKIDMINEKL